MAVLNGKLYFSWVQRSHHCIPEATRKAAANGNCQIAIGQTQLLPPTFAFLRALCGKAFQVFSVLLFSVPPCLRGGFLCQNGGLR